MPVYQCCSTQFLQVVIVTLFDLTHILQEIWYQLAFEGYSEAEAEWFPAHRIRSEYPHGDELIANFEVRHGCKSTHRALLLLIVSRGFFCDA